MWYSPSLQQLLFLEAVLEEGNFVRAADRLHTTHSTISRSLKSLGNGLGIDLFEITPRGLKPNNIGRIYGTQIRKTLEQARLAFDLARYEAALHRRPFSVGHSPYIHGDLLPLLEQITLGAVGVCCSPGWNCLGLFSKGQVRISGLVGFQHVLVSG